MLGEYQVVVSNPHGSVTSSVAQVRDRVIWRREDGGNGHGYTVVRAAQAVTWTTASALAANMGGYLACISSGAENEWVFGLAKASPHWLDGGNGPVGPWLGGRQKEGSPGPAVGWEWITGEPWSFTAWRVEPLGQPAEPSASDSSAPERFLGYTGQLLNRPRSYWNNNQDWGWPGIRSYCVEFNDSLSFIRQPESVVMTGAGAGPAVFTAIASGMGPKVDYQWRRNGVDVSSATNSTLQVALGTEPDDGRYSVVVRDGRGEMTSREARVLYPPGVVGHNLTNQFAAEGAQVRLYVAASGRPPIRFQWFRNAAPLPSATNAVLTLPGITLDQTANYHVEVSGVDGFTNSPMALVTVLPPTHVPVHLSDFEAALFSQGWDWRKRSFTPRGSRRFLGEIGNNTPRLTLRDIPPHTHLSLQFDLYLIRGVAPQGPTVRVRELVSGFDREMRPTTFGGLGCQDYPGPAGQPSASGSAGAVERHTLGYDHDGIEGRDAVHRVTFNMAHTGSEAVFVFEGSGWPATTVASWGLDNVAVSMASLQSSSPPILVHAPQSQVVHEGSQTAVFRTGAIGPGPVAYQWLKDGQPLLGATNDHLVLPPATTAQAGLYGIRVSNGNGFVERHSARLAIVTQMPESLTAELGSVAEIEAKAVGGATFQWFRNGQTVPGATSPRLRWENPAAEDAGDWSVRVSIHGASLDRFWGVTNRVDSNYPQVAFGPRGAPGQPLWTHRRPSPALDSGIEPAPFLSPPTVLTHGVAAVPSLRGVLGLSPEGEVKWEWLIGNGGNYGALAADELLGIGVISEVREELGESVVHCVDLLTGQPKWSRSIPGAALGKAAIGADGMVYVGTARLGVGEIPRLYALAPDGAVAWRVDTQDIRNQPAIAADGTIYTTESAPPGVDKDVVRIRAFRPDGSIRWEVAPGGSIDSSPTLAADGTIYVSWPGGELLAINPDGSRRWTFKPTRAGPDSAPTLDREGNIYLGCRGNQGSGVSVLSISPDGKQRWSATVGSDVGGPLMTDGEG
ncbi:MAG: PQQ-binding-like beta-propeller repeat protein, partial [Verrucomicrobiota bacterium]